MDFDLRSGVNLIILVTLFALAVGYAYARHKRNAMQALDEQIVQTQQSEETRSRRTRNKKAD